MAEQLLRFLLVEDDDIHAHLVMRSIHAHLVMRSLEQARVTNHVVRVADGQQAIDYLRQAGEFAGEPRPEIILLDLKLPKVDGHEVLSVIKTDETLRMIPVVVMTTSDAETDRAKAYEHHANSYVVKPVDFDKFRKLVEDLSLYWGVWNKPPF